MAVTRHQMNAEQQHDENSIDDSLTLDMEDVPEQQNIEHSQQAGQAAPQNQIATQADAEIVDWMQKEFQKATERNTMEEKLQCTSTLLGDRSIMPDHKVFLTMTDTSDNVCFLHSLTMVPSPHQAGNNQQAIAFFDKRRAEVSSTQWTTPTQAMEATQAKIPTSQAMTEAKRLNPTVKSIPIDESWKQASCPQLPLFQSNGQKNENSCQCCQSN